MSRRDSVRCPFCPRTIPEEEYRVHFDLFHAYDWDREARREYADPLPVRRRARPKAERDDDGGMFDDPG